MFPNVRGRRKHAGIIHTHAEPESMTEAGACDRIFVVEDHPLMRAVIRDYLGAMPGFEICGEAADAEQALELLEGVSPDLVLVDTTLSTMSGIDFVAVVRERWPALPCLMLSGHGQESYIARAFEAGASGYVLKGDPTELPLAIRRVLDGERYVSPRLRTPGKGR
jgi:DNA-binding NarL/FixJ family response regulator